MPHKNWCGDECASCERPCGLDQSIPCSPDCPEYDAEMDAPSGNEACCQCDIYCEDYVKVTPEVMDHIRDYSEDATMSDTDCREFFENYCSVWDSYEDLLFYLQEEEDDAELEQLKESKFCRKLSDGKILFLAY